MALAVVALSITGVAGPAASADPEKPAEPTYAAPTFGVKSQDVAPAPKPLVEADKKPATARRDPGGLDSPGPRPPNDDFGWATALAGNAGSVAGTNVGATAEPGEPPAGQVSVWYKWTPSVSGNAQVAVNQHGFDSEVDVYTGLSLSGVTSVAHNDDANGTLQSEVEFTAVAGTPYRIRVDGHSAASSAFRLSYGVGRPQGDDFGAAKVLPGAVGQTYADTTTATGEAGEPAPLFGAADASVWYSWTAPEAGTARISTNGSNYDTTLAAYTGTSLPGLTLAAANDDFNTALQSLITFPVRAGVVYRIQVGGYAGKRGALTLSFTVNPPANDLFATTQVITGGNGKVTGSTSRAIGEPGEPALASAPDATVWYRWTAPFTGTVQFRTCGSSFDTVLVIATGSSITGLSPVASNDDSPSCGRQSVINTSVTLGTVYQISVDGYSTTRGNIELSWS